MQKESFIKNEKYITLLNQVVMMQYLKKHKEDRNKLLNLKKEKEEYYRLFSNKKEFIQQKTNEKKKYTEDHKSSGFRQNGYKTLTTKMKEFLQFNRFIHRAGTLK